MVRVLTWAVMLVFVAGLLGAQTADSPAVKFFKTLRQKNFDRLPDNFTAELTGNAITNKLASIPKQYVAKTGKPYVEVVYTKAAGFAIKVKNVSSFYQDLYQDYSRYLNFGLTTPDKTDDSYIKRYDFSFVNSSSDVILLKLKVRGAEDSSVLYVNKDNYRIIRMDSMKGSDLLLSTIVTYKEMKAKNKTFYITDKFVVKRFNPKGTLPDVFDVVNIKIP